MIKYLILIFALLQTQGLFASDGCTCPNGVTYTNWMSLDKKGSTNFRGHIYSLEPTSENGTPSCSFVVASDEIIFIGEPRIGSILFPRVGSLPMVPAFIGNGVVSVMRKEPFTCSDMAYIPKQAGHIKVVPIMSREDSEVITELEVTTNSDEGAPAQPPAKGSLDPAIAGLGQQLDTFPYSGDLVALGKATKVVDQKGKTLTINPGTFGTVTGSDGINAKVIFYSSGVKWSGALDMLQLDFHVLNFGHWEVYKQHMTKLKQVEVTAPTKSLIPGWEYMRVLHNAKLAKNKKKLTVLDLLNGLELDDN